MKIKNIKPKEILDSRRNPTVEVELETNKGKFIASVPSGASKGSNEVLSLDASVAIRNIKKIILPALKNKEFKCQKEVDDILIGLDKTKLGVNAVLPVSIAVCRALAAESKLPVYKYLSNKGSLPKPCFNIIEGGAHAKNELDLQEFMIIPQKKTFKDNYKAASEIFGELKKLLNEETLGDEGGFAPSLQKTEQALLLISRAIAKHPETKIGIDAAATQFFKEEKYVLEGQSLTRNQLVDFYKDIVSRFPIVFIEDPFAEEDWQGFQEGRNSLSVDILGDDLTTTNIKRIKEAKSRNACNGVIIKLNQIGTVTETLEAVALAKEYGWKILVSHRSGETMDDFIADFAVGVSADYFKAGAPLTKERQVKYNRLLQIENEL